jgi:hypothetical protein
MKEEYFGRHDGVGIELGESSVAASWQIVVVLREL